MGANIMATNLFVAVGHDGLRLLSTNGIDWKNAVIGKEGEVYRCIAFGNGRFAAIGSYGGSNIFASTATVFPGKPLPRMVILEIPPSSRLRQGRFSRHRRRSGQRR